MADNFKNKEAGGLKKPLRSAKGRAQDDQVMGTNNSSIVSKRSVEKLYYPNEPHFFRYFVKKFQRRSPLINRGYFLRMHVIDVTVRDFLQRCHGGRQRVVINLGCGYDVLPWQTWTRHPEDCKDVKFIDIDFPDLMGRKQTTVLSEPQLLQPLTNLETFDTGTVLLKSDQYAQIGCDLRDLKALRVAISEVVDVSTAAFLFVAEVSITYMETEAADALIQWASALGRSEFGLLEQILPDGPGNPFAKTMLSHFDKLSTPLKSVHLYQTLQAQKDRFLSRGWVSVEAWSLWKAWGDITFLSSAERRKLDEVEPFDEWEEFALFASHYCIINARNYPDCRGHNNSSTASAQAPCNGGFPAGDTIDIDDSCGWYTENPGSKGRRRFGALMEMKNRLGEAYYANGLGLGPSSRLSSYDVYHARQPGVQFHEHTVLPAMDGGPSGRMCHTLTSLGAFGTLLVGGRTSPGSALKDCWLFMEGENRWKRTYDLPVPLYRHSIARLGTSSFALLMGGKTGSLSVFDGCLLFHPDKGWIDVRIMPKEGELWSPVFGANLCLDDIPVKRQTDGSYKWEGYLAGGIGSDGLIADQILLWEMEFTDSMADFLRLSVRQLSRTSPPSQDRLLLNRFGAVCLPVPGHPYRQTLVGGIIQDYILPHELEIVDCEFHESRVLKGRKLRGPDGAVLQRPLLVGHCAAASRDDNSIVILGGGATCFSMGTYWNKGAYMVGQSYNEPHEGVIVYFRTLEIVPEVRTRGLSDALSGDYPEAKVTAIWRGSLQSAEDFEKVIRQARPVVLEKADLGPCVSKWDLDYVVEKVGPERKTVVHVASSRDMDFNAKNFDYMTKTFGEVARELQAGRRLYLRALSADEPSDLPANLSNDFPSLSADFILPPELSFVRENTFSSVLRISGPVNMWLHYDVMANVYCQIHGSKRLILFPPTDVEYLGFAPGASSSSIDVFSQLHSPSLGRTHPYETILSPGDVLFIPPLWLHTATANSVTSIAVNVFFRDLEKGYSAGRDVYGNRDLAAYEKGRQDVNRIVNSFEKLPSQARDFYLLRLADELRQKVQS